MEIKSETYKNDNGSDVTKTVVTQTLEDGFVKKGERQPFSTGDLGRMRMGYSKSVTFETDDPRITRPFAYGIVSIFFIIGIALCFSSDWVAKFMGGFFTILSVVCFIKAKEEIDARVREREERNKMGENEERK